MRWNFIIWSFIACLALGQPSQEPPRPPSRTSCIRMTPEKEKQIDVIVEKLSDFLHNLTLEHEEFDIRLIKLAIEQHSADEVEEKETLLQLSVNDCQLTDDELDEIDHHKEKAKQHQLEEQQAEAEALKDEADDKTAKKNFEVMFLDLPENGQKLIQEIEKKTGRYTPLLVYVQKDKGQLNYLFKTKKK